MTRETKDRTVVFMTGNKHKLEEVQSILGDDWTVVSSKSLGFAAKVEETGESFAENAKIKAEAFLNWKGLNTVMAEDSGLIVDALNGAPGLFTARYAGPTASSEDNMDLLLNNLESTTNRSARFKAVISLYYQKQWHFFEGILEGQIAYEKKGTGGFGYDPVFLPAGHSKSLAELGSDWKDMHSHRAKAVKAMKDYLSSLSSSGAGH